MQKENRQHANCSRGFTLVELILVVGTIGLVSGALVGVVGNSYKDFRAGSERSTILQDGQAAIEQITRILRQAKAITGKGWDTQQWGWIEFIDADDIAMKIQLQQTGELQYGPPSSLSTLIGNVTELYIVCDDIDGNVVANTTVGTPEADQSAASVRFVSLKLGLEDNPHRFTGKVFLPIDHPIISPDTGPQYTYPGSENRHYTLPVAWYKLDGVIANDNFALDWSGNDKHGTFKGDPKYTNGKFGKAIELDGTNDYVEYLIALPGGVKHRTFAKFTVAVWAKAAKVDQGEWSGVFNCEATETNDFQIDVDGGSPGNYRYRSNQKSQVIGAVGTVTNINWVHLAVTCNGTDTKVYYNGGLKATILKEARGKFGRYTIGTNRGFNCYFEGDIDDLRVYDAELTATDIANVFEGKAVGSPVVWWKFDDYVLDSSGNANHGTPEGPVSVAGKIDKALSFDGVDDEVDCGNDATLNPDQLTVAIWFNPNSSGGSFVTKGSSRLTASDRDWDLYNNGSRLMWIGSNGSSYIWNISRQGSSALGTWHHVVGTWDGTTNTNGVNLYTEAHLAVSGAANRTDLATTFNVFIGGHNYFARFDGILDDVRIYDVALSAPEITALYLEWKEGALD